MVAAVMVWDEECWRAIQDRELQSCRQAGLLAQLLTWADASALPQSGLQVHGAVLA